MKTAKLNLSVLAIIMIALTSLSLVAGVKVMHVPAFPTKTVTPKAMVTTAAFKQAAHDVCKGAAWELTGNSIECFKETK